MPLRSKCGHPPIHRDAQRRRRPEWDNFVRLERLRESSYRSDKKRWEKRWNKMGNVMKIRCISSWVANENWDVSLGCYIISYHLVWIEVYWNGKHMCLAWYMAWDFNTGSHYRTSFAKMRNMRGLQPHKVRHSHCYGQDQHSFAPFRWFTD